MVEENEKEFDFFDIVAISFKNPLFNTWNVIILWAEQILFLFLLLVFLQSAASDYEIRSQNGHTQKEVLLRRNSTLRVPRTQLCMQGQVLV